jgi:hypothetical protein
MNSSPESQLEHALITLQRATDREGRAIRMPIDRAGILAEIQRHAAMLPDGPIATLSKREETIARNLALLARALECYCASHGGDLDLLGWK